MAIRIPACKWRRSRRPSGSWRRSPFIPVLLAAAPLPHQRQCQGWQPRGLSVCTLPHPSCSDDGCAGAPNEYRNRATVSRCGQIVLPAALGGQLSPCEAAPSIAASWPPTTLIGLRGRAVIAPGFASALRRSELLNPSWSRWDGSPLASGAVPVSSLLPPREITARGGARTRACLHTAFAALLVRASVSQSRLRPACGDVTARQLTAEFAAALLRLVAPGTGA
jgi:hypothetical protein